jgi:hypothetical protein
MKGLLSTISILRFVLSTLVAAILLAVPVAADEPPVEPFYRLPGRDVPLALVPEIASVGRYTDQWQATVMKSAEGSVMTTAQRTLDEGWMVHLTPIQEPPSKSSPSGKAAWIEQRQRLVTEVREALRAEPGVVWVYPAYRSLETGTLLLPTPYLLVKVAPGIDHDILARELSDLEVLRPLRLAERQWRLRITNSYQDPLEVARSLTERFAWIEWAEPDFVWQAELSALPNDPLIGQSWHLSNQGQGGGTASADARLDAAWNITTGDGSIVIAVIDDGVQKSHPDLVSRIFSNPAEAPFGINGIDEDGNGYVDDINGWDFRQNDYDADPDLTGPGSHGTSVAGVAAAAGGNNIGSSGACQSCRILPIRICDSAGFVGNSALAEAINYAASMADVLNNSWGGGSPAQAIMDAIDNARANGRGGKGAPTLFATCNGASGYMQRLAIDFTGVPAGMYTFEWDFVKDEAVDAGLDSAWIDNVTLPDGSFESFEGCTSLPAGWSTGAFPWSAVNNATRASSRLGGGCSIGAGATPANEVSYVNVSRYITGAAGSKVEYDLWVSAERINPQDPSGNGPLVMDECYDFLAFFFRYGQEPPIGPIYPMCGTYNNQGTPLRDGVLSFPSSYPVAISVGAATNFDRRSDYSQWGLDMNGNPGIDFVAHSSGGSRGITTPDIVGAHGYSSTDYTDTFGGTSSATPLAAGIVGLLLTSEPDLTYDQVRTRLRQATRKIGNVPYTAGYNLQFGHGALDAFVLLSSAPGSDLVFADGFESGDTSRWSSTES